MNDLSEVTHTYTRNESTMHFQECSGLSVVVSCLRVRILLLRPSTFKVKHTKMALDHTSGTHTTTARRSRARQKPEPETTATAAGFSGQRTRNKGALSAEKSQRMYWDRIVQSVGTERIGLRFGEKKCILRKYRRRKKRERRRTLCAFSGVVQ